MEDFPEEFAAFLVASEREQRELAKKILREDAPPFQQEYVTGVDVSYQGKKAFACAAVIHIPTRSIKRTESIISECEYPYIPGHFYLREGPIIIELLEEINETGPILIDGNGILHPRRMGLASYIGIKMNRQTVGVAKTLHLGSVTEKKGSIANVVDEGEVIGAALWIGQKQKPVYVSIGHRITLKTAIEITQAVSFNDYPEPLRQSHICAQNIHR